MNQIKICTPVTGNTLDEFFINLEKIQQISDFIELRVDYIQNLTPENISSIKNKTTKEAIFTCRSHQEGGKFADSETIRLEIIQKAIDLNFNYVDIEFETMKNHRFNLNEQTKIILSYHNFEETPEYWFMNKLMFEMKKFNPFIIKLATKVNDNYDNIKLYRLMVNKKLDDYRVIIGMGEKGKFTRILGPILGNYFTFAATEFSVSAPGQVDFEELKEIYDKLSITNY